jgi:hypothetical protein
VIDKCCMCKRNGESLDHVLLHCDVTYVVWSIIFNRFGMSYVMPRRVIELYDCWWSSGRPRTVAVRKMVPMCLFWCLWKEMNDINFEDKERSTENIIYLFFETLYL